MTVRIASISLVSHLDPDPEGILHIVVEGITLCGEEVVETATHQTATLEDVSCIFCRREMRTLVSAMDDSSVIDRSPFVSTNRRRLGLIG